MDSRASLIVVAVALCAVVPASGFLHDLLLQPLHEVKHALQPQPQYYQYRRAVYDQPQAGYARPVTYPVYQYQYGRPSSYEVGTAYSYGAGNNPFSSFLQGSWLPWANRQPVPQQQQQLQQQQLQQQPGVSSYAQPQQQQPPLQAFWSMLPWGGQQQQQAAVAAGHPQQPGPVVAFLQNPSSLLPWASSRPTVQYVTPLAPSSPASAALAEQQQQQLLHVVGQPASSEATLTASIKPVDAGDATGSLDALMQQAPAAGDVADNGVRRIAMVHAVHADGSPCV